MIYMTFKQWVNGRFLETGEPRKKAYSKAERDLVEMGWNYGYDAGVQWQKSQQALDKKTENARELGLDYEPEPKPVGHFVKNNGVWVQLDSTAWSNGSPTSSPLYTSPLKREWQGLTDDEIDLLEDLYAPPVHPDFVNDADHCTELIRHVEAKLKEKNT